MKTFKELTTTYLDHCCFMKQLNEKTIKAYRIDLRQYQDYLGDTGDFSSKNTLNSYILKLHNDHQPKTVKRKVATLRAFFRYLEYEEILDSNPFNKLNIRFREPIRIPKTMPLSTIESLLKTVYSQQGRSTSEFQNNCVLRDITVLELLFATGIRISELCSLKIEHIDFINRSILIRGKGDKERLIQIGNTEVIKLLVTYYSTFKALIDSSGWFFVNRLNNRLSEQSVRLMIRKYTGLSKISMHITPHMFRHSFATLLLEADVDIRYIQKMLGHSSISTTQIYTTVSVTKQREILTTKHPRNLLSLSNG